MALFLSKAGQNSKEVRMCHVWFRIDYFRLNLHLIIEILVPICWRSEFIIARSLCWEITRNNSINYFKFFPAFDKDYLHFWKYDASSPQLWRVPIGHINGALRFDESGAYGDARMPDWPYRQRTSCLWSPHSACVGTRGTVGNLSTLISPLLIPWCDNTTTLPYFDPWMIVTDCFLMLMTGLDCLILYC